MALKLRELDIVESRAALDELPEGKLMINTINAHSYNVAQKDEAFAQALKAGVLIPDGTSIVKACRFIKAKSRPKERIAGWDLFRYEMDKLENGLSLYRLYGWDMFRYEKDILEEGESSGERKPIVALLGSSVPVLKKIEERAQSEYPNLHLVTYSPPYKTEFSDEDNQKMIDFINQSSPDLLWIGMTAPKQEKWIYEHWDELDINCHVGAIGAVFDFYAGTVRRAPIWWQEHSLEWLYRLLKEPRRMWRRYLIGNIVFVYRIILEKL